MPPLPPVNHVLRVRTQWNLGGDLDVQSAYHLSYAGTPPTISDLTTMANTLSLAAGSRFHASLTSMGKYTGTVIEDLTSSTAPVGIDNTITNGTDTALPNAGSIAVNIQFQIIRRYRGGKPRVMLPLGSADGLATPQTWTPTFAAGIATLWSEYSTDVEAAAWSGGGPLQFVNVSYFEGFTAVVNPITGRSRNVPKLRIGGPVVDTVVGFNTHESLGHVRRRG